MKIEIQHAGVIETRDLEPGEYEIGRGPKDALRFEELAAGSARLWVEDHRLTFQASRAVRVGRAPLARGVRRLVLENEAIELTPELRILAYPGVPYEPSTAALALRMLRGEPVEIAPRLTCLTGPDAGRILPLPSRTVELGRGEGLAFRIRDRAVSRRHAAIHPTEAGHVLEDLGAYNGIYLDGARLSGTAYLESGSVIELGRTLLGYTGPVGPDASRASEDPERSIQTRPRARSGSARIRLQRAPSFPRGRIRWAELSMPTLM